MIFHELVIEDSSELNAALYARFVGLSAAGRVRQTHHFAGRFENTYIDKADIPGVTVVLETVMQQAGQLLDVAVTRLKAGFWFNAMQAGDMTTPHHHDENDELLSAVYYIRAPENSGDLILHDEGETIRVRPQEGKLVMFAPQVVHEVTANLSSELRLSVAVNVGPVTVAS